ncbi:uncharacterized protein [Populus alba]|uniref:uncharacterized protein isoform X2 n=1 Tax=Populus alba TaxID=43335 RepID=UPI00158E86CF|nr:clathrin light chain 2-like isoform X2 [Populus alba]
MSSFTDESPREYSGSFRNFDANSLTGNSSPVFASQSYSTTGDDLFSSQPVSDDGGFSPEQNGISDGPILPPPSEMESEEGFALREWRRENAIRLEEKEKKEKEMLKQIVEEAEEYKKEFYRKRQLTLENNKAANREKEKVTASVESLETAHQLHRPWMMRLDRQTMMVRPLQKRARTAQQMLRLKLFFLLSRLSILWIFFCCLLLNHVVYLTVVSLGFMQRNRTTAFA